MSTFIWGKIRLLALPDNFKSYQRDDILVFFDIQKNDLFLSDLESKEIYFNIACGYEEMIYPRKYKMNCLNCDTHFFSIDFPKHPKNIKTLEPYFIALHERIKRLQKVILEIYERPEVESITYFHTESGNEISLDEYESVDWKINEIADQFFERIVSSKGFAPSIKVVFQK